jgi:hypothetical protein
MPKLPDSNSLGVETARPSQNVVSYEAGAQSRANANLGATITNIGEHLQDRQDELEVANAKSTFLQNKVKTLSDLQDDTDYKTYAQRYNDSINQAKESALGMVRSGRARRFLTDDFDVQAAEGLAQVNHRAKALEVDDGRANLINLMDTNRESALRVGDETTRAGLINATQQAIQGAADKGYIKDHEAVNLRKKFTESYAEGAISLLPLDQQIKTLDLKSQGGNADFIPSDKRQALMEKAQRELQAQQDRARILADRERALYREDLSFRLQDAEAAYLSGKDFPNAPTKKDFQKAFDPGQAARHWQSFKSLQDASLDISNLYRGTPEERSAIIQKIEPIPGEGFAEREKIKNILVQTNNRIDSLQKADPAGYVAQFNPEIQQSFQAAVNGDQGAIADYSLRTLAEQKRLGIKEPMILPKQVSNQIAAQFYDQTQGGQNAAKLMDDLQSQWGPAFPKVYEQLAKEDKIPAAAMVIPNLSDDGAKERLARWSLVDDKVFEERLPDKNSNVKDIKSTLLNTMAPFWNSLSVQNGGEKTYNAFQSQAYKLALGYAASGKSPSDAAQQAYEETVGHAYDFGPTYRVPKLEAPDQVMAGTRAVLRNVDQLNIAPFPSQVGLTAAQAQKATLDIVKNNPVWVTNSDETGLTLYAQGNNGLNLIRDKSGKPIEMTWQQLREAAAKTPTTKPLPSGLAPDDTGGIVPSDFAQ